jgi:myo-inositol-1(or 4)-monophosphatase
MRARDIAGAGLIDFAHTLADLSGPAILRYFRRSIAVNNKAEGRAFDPVTAADRAAERVIRAAIAKRFPDHGILGEEFAARPGAGRFQWVLDPIDGTRTFITGSPLWGTMIGLLESGAPVLGLVDQPFIGERFWADRRTGRMRGPDGKARKLRTRACASLADAVLTSTHPDLFTAPDEIKGFARLKTRARMTRYGGDCYGYCLLAAGFVDVIVESGLKPHDVVALIPIIEAAGGRITTWDNEPAQQGGRILAAGDPRVHREALVLLKG